MKKTKKNINGVVLLDKPEGLSSNHALQRVKHLYHAAKAGHTGSLDPMATGVLPLCFGEATKFSNYGLDADKSYDALVKLGVTTATGDREGEVIATAAVPEITLEKLLQLQQQFLGPQQQIPPMYSALKKDGVPLYRLARQGQEIERLARDITIYQLHLEQVTADVLKLQVMCSKGTYVRTLGEDIGAALGCGAHLIALRRTAVGKLTGPIFTLEQLMAFDEMQLVQCLMPVDALVIDLPMLVLNDLQQEKLCQGQKVILDNAELQGTVRVYNNHQQFLGLAEVNETVLQAKRLVATNIEVLESLSVVDDRI